LLETVAVVRLLETVAIVFLFVFQEILNTHHPKKTLRTYIISQ